ncbi:MAG: Elongation factor P [Candidatus Jorgensenbacteria bacterium GW2011_GWF2_41_8]|uniref:Elongation factor P n=1 Tax=Candidatus Jorgensenbacteria bacterium GW2011_GWF2_41_8 TaxID=1618667 RepID=A0A0G1AG90_9BACT|nr:MAG: Elongation factor P [Candidatus Jorgensenbacteria bacterium GW2011_GWF2_41_8]
MALGVNELKQKTFFIYEGQPFVVLETFHLKMQQRRPTVQVKMRNLMNGKILERNFAQSDVFEEAAVQRQGVKFLYAHRNLLTKTTPPRDLNFQKIFWATPLNF